MLFWCAPTGTTNANSVEVKGWATDANMRYYACYITTNQPIYAFGTNWSTGQEPKDAGNSLWLIAPVLLLGLR